MTDGLIALLAAIRGFSADTPIIASFPVDVEIDGQTVQIRREFWLSVSDFLDGQPPSTDARLMRTTDGVNIREQADVASDKIGSLVKGAEVSVVGEITNGYLKLRDRRGWVSAEWLETIT